MGAATTTNIPMKTENLPRITTDFDDEFGWGFAVRGDLRKLVSRFIAVDERLTAIRIKAKYFYISLICAHAPTEDKDDTTKDAFYDKLEVA